MTELLKCTPSWNGVSPDLTASIWQHWWFPYSCVKSTGFLELVFFDTLSGVCSRSEARTFFSTKRCIESITPGLEIQSPAYFCAQLTEQGHFFIPGSISSWCLVGLYLNCCAALHQYPQLALGLAGMELGGQWCRCAAAVPGACDVRSLRAQEICHPILCGVMYLVYFGIFMVSFIFLDVWV